MDEEELTNFLVRGVAALENVRGGCPARTAKSLSPIDFPLSVVIIMAVLTKIQAVPRSTAPHLPARGLHSPASGEGKAYSQWLFV
jgi:hypothetical protein